MKKEIIFLNPVFTHNIWGGTKLRDEYGYDIEGDDIGECWGIAAHENGNCTVKEGMYKGETLAGLWSEHRELFGNIYGDRFPLLVKSLMLRRILVFRFTLMIHMRLRMRMAHWARWSAGIFLTVRKMHHLL